MVSTFSVQLTAQFKLANGVKYRKNNSKIVGLLYQGVVLQPDKKKTKNSTLFCVHSFY